MTDESIEEIYILAQEALKRSQKHFKVHIFPFRFDQVNFASYSSSKWYKFWKNLKEGHDYFEKKKVPPNVEVEGEKYIFD